MKRPVTIKDLARQLNISPSTVSRALRDHPDIRKETKQMVRSLAEALDYQPDSIAQSLQKRKTNIIGVIVPVIKHNFFSNAISGIEEVAYKNGYAIIVSQSHEDYQREEMNIKALISNRVDGLLISISQTTENVEPFRLLQRRQVPFVFFDRVIENINASLAMVDDFDGAFRAVEHLIQKGYRRIAHLAGHQSLRISEYRYNGYLTALRKHNIPVDHSLIVTCGLDEEGGKEGFRQLAKTGDLPDAIFAVNDPVALGAFEEIKKRGLRIPQDVALVGFSNNPISALINPPLTTVDQPAYELGKSAAELLLDQINSEESIFTPRKVVLKTKLIVREST